MQTITLSSKGQLVIPKTIRDDVGVAFGHQLTACVVDGEIRLRPLLARPAAPVQLDAVAGCLARTGGTVLSDAQTRLAIMAKLKARNQA